MRMMVMAIACTLLFSQNHAPISLFQLRLCQKIKLSINITKQSSCNILIIVIFFLQVISVRPFMTFTNRLGQDIFIKLSTEDEPKVLRASDSRVSFVCRGIGAPEKLQVGYSSQLIYCYNN